MATLKFVWMINTKGREVEVPAADKAKLEKCGFTHIKNPHLVQKITSPALTIGHPEYPHAGYGRVQELLEKRIAFAPGSPNVVYFGYPREIKREKDKAYFLVSAFEADRIPADWPKLAEYFDCIILPSRFCVDIFREGGVKVPLTTMIQGTDNYNIVSSPTEYPFTFIHYNSFSAFQRKGEDLLAKAFVNVFGHYDKVRLILKGRVEDNARDIKAIPKKKNIEIIVKNMNRIELAKFQEQAHCMVFPSRGEGLGLPPLECLVRGIPTIVTDWSGMTEYSQLAIRLKNYEKCPAVYPRLTFNNKPQWVEPSLKELEEKLFYVYRNYERVKQDAIRNAVLVSRIFNLENTIGSFIKTVKTYGIV